MKKEGIRKFLISMHEENEELIRKHLDCTKDDDLSAYDRGFVKGALAARCNVSRDLIRILGVL